MASLYQVPHWLADFSGSGEAPQLFLAAAKKAFNEERSHNNLIQEDVDEHEIDEIDVSSLC